MRALYLVRYTQFSQAGAAVLYIGDGEVLGIDVGEMRYHGKYSVENGTIKLQGTLNGGEHGGTLVTGQPVLPGQTLELSATWPSPIPANRTLTASVGSGEVQLVLEKIGDIGA